MTIREGVGEFLQRLFEKGKDLRDSQISSQFSLERRRVIELPLLSSSNSLKIAFVNTSWTDISHWPVCGSHARYALGACSSCRIWATARVAYLEAIAAAPRDAPKPEP